MLQKTAKIVLGILAAFLVLSQVHRHATAALRQEPADSWNELGLDYLNSHDWDKAIQAFRNAVDTDPAVAEYHFNLACVYENHPKAAVRVFGMSHKQLYRAILDESLKARLLNPGDIRMAKTYAWFCRGFENFGASADWERTLEAWQYCLQLRERTYEANPSNVNYSARVHPLLEIARIYLELNREEEAREHIDSALSMFPESKIAQILLARCR